MMSVTPHSLLWRLLIPVLIVGVFTSFLLNFFLVPPLVASIEQRIDKTISHTANMAISICEERFSDMLDLRMEENEEMNIAAKAEAIEGIKAISSIFPNVQMVIFDNEGIVLGASFPVLEHNTGELLQALAEKKAKGGVYVSSFFGEKVIFYPHYFPFWRWNIVSFIEEEHYLLPIQKARQIIGLGTFGTLLAVIASMLVLFYFWINRPLQRMISTTKAVRHGAFTKVNLRGYGEIGEVAVAFDDMIDKLERDRLQIDRIMEELGESEEKYRILSENSLALVAVVHANEFRYANRAAAEFFGLSPQEMVEKNIFQLFEPDQQVRLNQSLESLKDGRTTMEHFELRYTTSGGKKRWLEVLASVIPFGGGTSILIHGLDISERKTMEAEQRALREKAARGERMEILGTLAGGVAHDLNNILGGIVGYPELLLHGMDDQDPVYKPLKTIQKSGEKAAAIVQDLLTLTRRGVMVTEVVDLRRVVKEYLASPEVEKLISFYPQVEVQTEFADELLNIVGSPYHLSKTIMNLVTNGVEAMVDGGVITIGLENRYVDFPVGEFEEVNEGEYVVLTVSDQGQGISKENLSRIFEPFFTKKVMGRSGTGLGMSVVWGTVKDHQGYIEVRSEEGRGSTFSLYFPATRKVVEERSAAELIEAWYDQSGRRILVVDDVEEQRDIAASMLRRLGYTVDVVDSGEAALQAARDGEEYDLFLLDMIMDPGMDGFDTFRRILDIKPQQKAIIASGYSETERVRRALQLGAGSYLKKPFGLKALAEAVAKVLAA